jgi:hypothetical protein
MPIQGISDIVRFTRAGKIRIGEKKTNAKGQEYPSKLDYFLPDFDDADLEAEFHKQYGEKPKRLRIVFVSEDLNLIFPQWYKCYGKTGLKCKGDGITAERHNDTGIDEEVACLTPEGCDYAKEHGCKRLASLQFALPDLPTMQVVQFDTTSFYSIVNLNSGLAQMRAVFGQIRGIEVDLDLLPQQAQANGKAVNIYVVRLAIPVSLRQVRNVRPLIGYVDVSAPAPAEDKAPDDLLYPASMRRGERVHETTGEILPAEDAEQPVTSVTAPSLSDDPDVNGALDASGFTPAKCAAMLASAERDGWSKEQLLGVIAKHNGNGKPANAPAAAAPATDKPARPKTLF